MSLGEVHIQRALFSLPIGRKYSSSWTPNLASGIFPKAMANGILLTIQAIILLNAVHFENTDLLAKSLGKAIYLGQPAAWWSACVPIVAPGNIRVCAAP